MRLSTKNCARKLKIAGVAALLVLGACGGAMGQTLQPKAAVAPAGGAAPEGGAAAEPAQPSWAVNCDNSQKGLDCRAVQSLFLKNTGQRLLTVAVRVPPDSKKPTMLIQVPLGVYLPAGITLQVGKEAAKTLPYQNCNQAGCIAEYAVTEAEIAAMQKGSDLRVSVQNLAKQTGFDVTVSVLGFDVAYAKVK